jgi:hypothetical protein
MRTRNSLYFVGKPGNCHSERSEESYFPLSGQMLRCAQHDRKKSFNRAKSRRKGYILILVIMILSLVEVCMILLTCSSNTFIFQANRDYLEACRQNLVASGLAWSKANLDSLKVTQAPIELNTSEMSIKKAALSIAVSEKQKGAAQVEINTSCTRGRQTINSVREFTVSARTAVP